MHGLSLQTYHIFLENMEILADIGFCDFEIGAPQRLRIDARIELDMAQWPADDTQQHAWDYDRVRAEIAKLAGERRYNLQETLARAIFDRIAGHEGVRALWIRIAKIDVYPDVKAVGVEISSSV